MSPSSSHPRSSFAPDLKPMLPPSRIPDLAPSPSRSQPPPKRSRKAINCQPCRASKLKCDRARPCSSCVLRGTSTLCYPDGRPDPDNLPPTVEDIKLDPQVEIQKMRHSLSVLESHILRSTLNNETSPLVPSTSADLQSGRLSVSRSNSDPDSQYTDNTSAPATLATQTDAGFYAGPTSSVTHLMGIKECANLHHTVSHAVESSMFSFETMSLVDDHGDQDLLNCLPEYHIVDQVLSFFYDNCCVMNLYITKSQLLISWENFKKGTARTRITMCLVFCVIAITIQFLPPQHELFLYLRRERVGSIAELSEWYYEHCCQSLVRHENDTTMPSIDLVEAHLVKMFYLGISKSQAEELWRLRGCCVSNALALGLHRDPSKWNIPYAMAERRRWTWFNVLRVERWHAFMLGRPTAFNNNHFDTVFPSSIDPYNSERVSNRDHLPYLHMFRLSILFGDIMNDMVSVKPVPHESIMVHHKAIEQWMDNFPEELRYEPHTIAPAFAGNNALRRTTGIQSLCLKLAGLHTQLAVHRPYATNSSTHSPRGDQSLQLALKAANAIILWTTSSRPNYLSNPALTVPGHIHWGVLHLFAATIFLAFQVISWPGQPTADEIRNTITRGLIDMEALRGIPAADKAITIIHALRPLYEDTAHDGPSNLTQKKKDSIINLASRLPFPFLDSPGQRAQRGQRSVHSASPPAISQSPITNSTSNRESANLMHIPDHVLSYMNGGPASFLHSQYLDTTQGLYTDRRGPILPTQTHKQGDETFWSSAVGMESNDWSRFMHDVIPKPAIGKPS